MAREIKYLLYLGFENQLFKELLGASYGSFSNRAPMDDQTDARGSISTSQPSSSRIRKIETLGLRGSY